MSARTDSTRSRRSAVVGRSYARAQIYGLLARLVVYPDDDVVTQLTANAPRALAAARYLRFPEEEIEATLERVTAGGADELERSYQKCFTLTYSPDVPAYEVAYVSSEVFRQTQELADIAGFYRAFGAELGGGKRERVDHIAVELAFMQLLCLKEAFAAEHKDAEHLRVCREAQRSFLRDHLLCWAPSLGERMAVSGGASIHGAAGRVLVAWLRREQTSLRVAPRQAYDRPLPAEPEPEAQCAAESVIPLVDIT